MDTDTDRGMQKLNWSELQGLAVMYQGGVV